MLIRIAASSKKNRLNVRTHLRMTKQWVKETSIWHDITVVSPKSLVLQSYSKPRWSVTAKVP